MSSRLAICSAVVMALVTLAASTQAQPMISTCFVCVCECIGSCNLPPGGAFAACPANAAGIAGAEQACTQFCGLGGARAKVVQEQVAGECAASVCPTATSAPAVRVPAAALIVAGLIAVGVWRVRRRPASSGW